MDTSLAGVTTRVEETGHETMLVCSVKQEHAMPFQLSE